MKVLWINPSFLDYRIPLYVNLFKLLDGKFSLLYSKSRVPQRVIDRIEDELGVNALGMSGEKSYIIGRKSEFANTYISIPWQPGLWKTIKSTKPDLIIAEGFFQWTPWAVIYAAKNKIPLYIAYERTEHTERNCPKWRTWYRRFVSKFITGFLVNGSLTSDYLKKTGLAENKIIVEGCMSADSFVLSRKVEKRKLQYEIKDVEEKQSSSNIDGFKFLYVGQIIDRKGVDKLLDAWSLHEASYPLDTLFIVGSGPLLEDYKKAFGSLKNVIFTGGVDYDEIDNYYAVADVFVIPTLEDNWSLVVPEAMACGLPIACSIYNGCYPELVKEQNGVLFDPLKQESVVDALAYFHKEGIDLTRMGSASVEIEKEYSPDKVAESIVKGVLKTKN